MTPEEIPQDRDSLRNAAFDADEEDSAVIEHKGRKYELRCPSLEQQRAYARAAGGKNNSPEGADGFRMLVLAIIGCTFVPGTQTKVFERADEAALMKKTPNPRGLVGKLAKQLNKMMGVKTEDVEKSFDEAPISD